ncbi:MAPEG family protein [Thermomonas flagellata]|uniref:MAPEG family protein n=1 Tax=Thermomonas flagellata TaxID=2888524 RepID=UPI001F0391F6|nr:MAPEG family protein [Thermomonas flagellata]
MAIAYWCVLIAAVLPYVWVAIAKRSGRDYNNKDPRGWIARQQDYRVRNAWGAHLNAFEAFPPFAAGVLMAQWAQVEPPRIAWLAVAFVAARVLHGLFYLGGLHYLRSLAWLLGLLCVLALMGSAALRIGG